MLDIKFIRENPDLVKQVCEKKQVNVNIDELLGIDKEKKRILKMNEDLRAIRNELTRKISEQKNSELLEQAIALKEEINKNEEELKKIEEKHKKLLYLVPNLLASDVPDGKDENDNKVLRKWGKPTELGFKPKDHMELGEALDIIDTKTSAKVSGARFNYLKKEAVFLQFALVQFAFDTLSSRKIIAKIAKSIDNPFDTPFVPVIPPVIAKAEVMKKLDRFDPIEDRYYLEKDDALLVGSAEHTLGPMHMDEVLNEKNLPIRYLGYSTSFRREAGTYGKDTRGILRRHQFDKLEMESFGLSEYGMLEQKLMTAIQEYLMQQLKIPYQVVIICTGDMGKPDYRQVDIEAWMPGQGKYRETHTSDYMTNYQARRLNTKVRRKDGKTEFVHMNDATCFAIGRTIIAILENYQQKDGSVKMPKVLHKYLGFKKINKK